MAQSDARVRLSSRISWYVHYFPFPTTKLLMQIEILVISYNSFVRRTQSGLEEAFLMSYLSHMIMMHEINKTWLESKCIHFHHIEALKLHISCKQLDLHGMWIQVGNGYTFDISHIICLEQTIGRKPRAIWTYGHFQDAKSLKQCHGQNS